MFYRTVCTAKHLICYLRETQIKSNLKPRTKQFTLSPEYQEKGHNNLGSTSDLSLLPQYHGPFS